VHGFLEEDPETGGGGPLVPVTFHHDQVTSVVGLSGHTGAVEQRRVYAPFGETLSETGASGAPGSGPLSNELAYTGRERDPATGLYYVRARWYDPDIGRFLSEDPLGFGAGDVNLYAYVGNNPLSGNDPTGEIANFVIGGAIGGGGELLAQFLESKITGQEFSPDFGRIALAAGTGAAGVGLANLGNRIFQGTRLLATAGRAGFGAGSEVVLGGTQELITTGELPSLSQSLFLAAGGAGSSLVGDFAGSLVRNSSSSQSAFIQADRLQRIAQNRIDQGLPRPSRITSRLNQASSLIGGVETNADIASTVAGGLISISTGLIDRGFDAASSGPTAGGGFVLFPSRPNLNSAERVYAK